MEKSSWFHFSASLFGHQIFNHGEGHARGWERFCVHKTKRETEPATQRVCFWQLWSFLFEGKLGPLDDASITTQNSRDSSSLIQKISRMSRTGDSLCLRWKEGENWLSWEARRDEFQPQFHLSLHMQLWGSHHDEERKSQRKHFNTSAQVRGFTVRNLKELASPSGHWDLALGQRQRPLSLGSAGKIFKVH